MSNSKKQILLSLVSKEATAAPPVSRTTLRDTSPKEDWITDFTGNGFNTVTTDYKIDKYPTVNGVEDHTPRRLRWLNFKSNTADPTNIRRARDMGRRARKFIRYFDKEHNE